MSNIPTPHIAATKEQIANTVIMPGDPKRSRFIAMNLLEGAELINDIRGVQGYTGTYKGHKVTTMASGIGIPAMGLYSYELFHFYGVDNIIRVGTCGSINPSVKVRDVIIAETAYTNSIFYTQLGFAQDYIPKASPKLVEMAKEIALSRTPQAAGIHTGAVLTQELYYSAQEDIIESWAAKDVLAFEMEAACLYGQADYTGKNALALLSVSNDILTGTEMDPAERETTFIDMLTIALEMAVKLDQ